MVLHGRVVQAPPPKTDGGTDTAAADTLSPPPVSYIDARRASRAISPTPSNGDIRSKMERKSIFYSLKDDIQKFSKHVEKLEEVLRRFAGSISHSASLIQKEGNSNTPDDEKEMQRPQQKENTSPEEAWRLRILTKGAIDSDKLIWEKLHNYEKSLKEHSQEQTECMKLHRDFKRAHKALVMCMSLIEENRGKHAVLQHLTSVGWSGLATSAGEQAPKDEPKYPEQQPRQLPQNDTGAQQHHHPPLMIETHFPMDEPDESILDPSLKTIETQTIDTSNEDDDYNPDLFFFEACLSPREFFWGGLSDEVSRDLNKECGAAGSHWHLTLEMIAQDVEALRRNLVRAGRRCVGTTKTTTTGDATTDPAAAVHKAAAPKTHRVGRCGSGLCES